jgi:hypothetical protein
LNDHKCKSYYEGLLEVRSVRSAAENPPKWTAFDDDDTCSSCASHFTWASTSNTEAQEARDKHNCRSCGSLVCDPCSTNRVSIPSIGIIVPSRVCDRCYNGGELSLVDSTKHIGCVADDKKATAQSRVDEKPERTLPRRIKVVDDLARQVQISPLACL